MEHSLQNIFFNFLRNQTALSRETFSGNYNAITIYTFITAFVFYAMQKFLCLIT